MEKTNIKHNNLHLNTTITRIEKLKSALEHHQNRHRTWHNYCTSLSKSAVVGIKHPLVFTMKSDHIIHDEE